MIFNFLNTEYFSNLNINFKTSKLNDSSESYKKSNSNDFFDLSTSNQFIIHSPKFNENSLAFNFNQKENKEENNKKEEDNQILNDSFLKDLKQSKNLIFKKYYNFEFFIF